MQEKQKFFKRKKLITQASIVSYVGIILIALSLPNFLPTEYNRLLLAAGLLAALIALALALYARKKF